MIRFSQCLAIIYGDTQVEIYDVNEDGIYFLAYEGYMKDVLIRSGEDDIVRALFDKYVIKISSLKDIIHIYLSEGGNKNATSHT